MYCVGCQLTPPRVPRVPRQMKVAVKGGGGPGAGGRGRGVFDPVNMWITQLLSVRAPRMPGKPPRPACGHPVGRPPTLRERDSRMLNICPEMTAIIESSAVIAPLPAAMEAILVNWLRVVQRPAPAAPPSCGSRPTTARTPAPTPQACAPTAPARPSAGETQARTVDVSSASLPPPSASLLMCPRKRGNSRRAFPARARMIEPADGRSRPGTRQWFRARSAAAGTERGTGCRGCRAGRPRWSGRACGRAGRRP